MKIKEIKAKSIIGKTKLSGDFVINPYIGCVHGCKYCYARFMKKFTNHKEPWGSFVDVKINAPDLIPEISKKYRNKNIIIGSVTDPYNPLEKKYRLTRQILKKLIPLQPCLDIITKSDLVVRDIDLLRQLECIVALSASGMNEKLRKQLEPFAPSINKRINTLKKLHRNGIKTALFISPIFPELSNWKSLIDKTKDFVDEYWFENLNLYPSIKDNIFRFLKKNKPELVDKYREIYSGNSYWSSVEREIRKYCKEKKVNFNIYFHHRVFRNV